MQVLEHCCGSGYRISCLESDLYIFYPKLPKTLDQTTATPWQLENLACKVNNAQISGVMNSATLIIIITTGTLFKGMNDAAVIT